MPGNEFFQLEADFLAQIEGVVAVDQGAQSVNAVAVQHDVQFDQVGRFVFVWEVIERCVTAGNGLEFVVKVKNNFSEWHAETELDAVRGQVDLVTQYSTLLDAEVHDLTDVLAFGDDLCLDEWLLYVVEVVRFGQVGRVVDNVLLAVLGEGVVTHVGDGGDNRHVKFPFEPLLDDFHVEHAQEATAEPEPQGCRRFRFEYEGGVIELEFFHRGAKLFVVLGVHGVNARKDHGLDILKPFYAILTRIFFERDGVSDLDFTSVFDAGNDVAYVAGCHFLTRLQVHSEHPNFIGLVFAIGGKKLDLIAFFEAAVEDAVIGDDAPKGVVNAIKNHGLQRGLWIAFGRRYAFHDCLEDVFHAQTGLSAGRNDIVHGTADEVHDLIAYHFRVGRVQIHFIQDWNNLQIVFKGEVQVRNGLSLNALRSIYDEQRTFACCNGTRHFVTEVYVSGGVD